MNINIKEFTRKRPVIFSDVDGTIYRHFKLLESTKQDVLHAVIKAKSHFNICTGNPVKDRMLELVETLKARYLIGSSGAQIYDVKNKEIIKSWHIDFETTKKILEVAKINNFQVIFWDNEKYYYLIDDKASVESIGEYHFTQLDRLNEVGEKYAGQFIEPVKIEFYSLTNPETEAGALEMFEHVKHFDNVTMIPTDCNIEISPLNVDKGSAIKWMIENIYNQSTEKYDALTLNDVMTIGDSNNDLPMIKITHYSYAMANACKNVLNSATFFTSAVEQNGLGEAVFDYLYRYKNYVKKYLLHDFHTEEWIDPNENFEFED
ncbi:HAD family phosphatase [[Mycoplasma] falconis]|uniref:HAD family phosphatase n=1 Tax=[Mycoplasma] falconis TaxID=92403 RepID=A0A501XAG0_9BACT|nr:HAD family hydrolase [[Mycoplasma] falconis]TPE57565.1 HAD family phosphatase [[Mycoplasma] falconis]